MKRTQICCFAIQLVNGAIVSTSPVMSKLQPITASIKAWIIHEQCALPWCQVVIDNLNYCRLNLYNIIDSRNIQDSSGTGARIIQNPARPQVSRLFHGQRARQCFPAQIRSARWTLQYSPLKKKVATHRHSMPLNWEVKKKIVRNFESWKTLTPKFTETMNKTNSSLPRKLYINPWSLQNWHENTLSL